MSERVPKKRRKKRRGGWHPLGILLIFAVAFAVFSVHLSRDGRQDTGRIVERVIAAEKQEAGGSVREYKGNSFTDEAEAGSRTEWNLLLVNPWNAVPEDFSVQLADLPGGHKVDARCRDELLAMLDDCRAAGLSPLICSSYRTMEKQQSLYENKVSSLMARGMGREDARRYAASTVAYPGTSEHQIGLAVDLVDESYQLLDTGQEKTAVQRWLMENSWKYGFILRYPNDKSDLTGIIYEPWHYRYVGREAAQEIYERGICLEEYLEEINESVPRGI